MNIHIWRLLKWLIKIFGKYNQPGGYWQYLFEDLEFVYAKYHDGEIISMYKREEVIFDQWEYSCKHKQVVDTKPDSPTGYPWDAPEPFAECLDCGYILRDDRKWAPRNEFGLPDRQDWDEL